MNEEQVKGLESEIERLMCYIYTQSDLLARAVADAKALRERARVATDILNVVRKDRLLEKVVDVDGGVD